VGHLPPVAALCGRQIEFGVLHNDHEMSNVSGMLIITIYKNVDCKGYLLRNLIKITTVRKGSSGDVLRRSFLPPAISGRMWFE